MPACKEPNAPIYIYVISSEMGPVKIGLSSDVQNGLKILQTGFPYKLSIYFHERIMRSSAGFVEKKAHATLAKKRLQGEWFDATVDNAISAVRDAIGAFGYIATKANTQKEKAEKEKLVNEGRRIKAARMILEWNCADLAREAGVGAPTIWVIENGKRQVSKMTMLSVRKALEDGGVHFIDEEYDDNDYIGVKTRKVGVALPWRPGIEDVWKS